MWQALRVGDPTFKCKYSNDVWKAAVNEKDRKKGQESVEQGRPSAARLRFVLRGLCDFSGKIQESFTRAHLYTSSTRKDLNAMNSSDVLRNKQRRRKNMNTRPRSDVRIYVLAMPRAVETTQKIYLKSVPTLSKWCPEEVRK